LSGFMLTFACLGGWKGQVESMSVHLGRA
jgi:hypothetical protein